MPQDYESYNKAKTYLEITDLLNQMEILGFENTEGYYDREDRNLGGKMIEHLPPISTPISYLILIRHFCL
jgi:hypothetical protein